MFIMKIEVLTIFPELFGDFARSSLIGKAHDKGLLSLSILDIREFAPPPHYSVDDSPYGGGAGMVMKPEPIVAAIEDSKKRLPHAKVILLTPSGKVFSQSDAARISSLKEVIFVCGRYEGIDQRAIDLAVDEELSIGDYILMGGEIPAMVIIEASARLVDQVIGNSDSLSTESFNSSPEGILLEAPHYTRPPVFRDKAVPEVLLSGDHAKIQKWRLEEARARTKARRPDLSKNIP